MPAAAQENKPPIVQHESAEVAGLSAFHMNKGFTIIHNPFMVDSQTSATLDLVRRQRGVASHILAVMRRNILPVREKRQLMWMHGYHMWSGWWLFLFVLFLVLVGIVVLICRIVAKRQVDREVSEAVKELKSALERLQSTVDEMKKDAGPKALPGTR